MEPCDGQMTDRRTDADRRATAYCALSIWYMLSRAKNRWTYRG